MSFPNLPLTALRAILHEREVTPRLVRTPLRSSKCMISVLCSHDVDQPKCGHGGGGADAPQSRTCISRFSVFNVQQYWACFVQRQTRSGKERLELPTPFKDYHTYGNKNDVKPATEISRLRLNFATTNHCICYGEHGRLCRLNSMIFDTISSGPRAGKID